MPCYVFEHPKTGQTIEVIQSVKEEHVYVDEDGTEWWKDEVGVWWWRGPDDEEWSEYAD